MLTTWYDRLIRIPTRIDRFLTPSEFLRQKLIQGGFAPARIATVPNFVDLSAYRSLPEKDYFLYVGRLSPEKGVDILIRAVSRCDAGRLVIVGSGPEEEALKRLAGELGASRVEFAGYKSGDDLKTILAEAQFVVLPSRWYENLPFAVMEAFAASKAVVASDIGGIPEMVDDGVNGLLFLMGDEDALVDRLGRLLRDPAARLEMGRKGREKAERLYDREAHYGRIARIDQDLLDR
jgi:glycosyltransferase involved in cell wall biosynthesis